MALHRELRPFDGDLRTEERLVGIGVGHPAEDGALFLWQIQSGTRGCAQRRSRWGAEIHALMLAGGEDDLARPDEELERVEQRCGELERVASGGQGVEAIATLRIGERRHELSGLGREPREHHDGSGGGTGPHAVGDRSFNAAIGRGGLGAQHR